MQPKGEGIILKDNQKSTTIKLHKDSHLVFSRALLEMAHPNETANLLLPGRTQSHSKGLSPRQQLVEIALAPPLLLQVWKQTSMMSGD